MVAKGELHDGQYRLIGETIVDEAEVASVMSQSMMIFHRFLCMNKLRLGVFLNRIYFELKTLSNFFTFSVESYTSKAPVESLRRMRNYVDHQKICVS